MATIFRQTWVHDHWLVVISKTLISEADLDAWMRSIGIENPIFWSLMTTLGFNMPGYWQDSWEIMLLTEKQCALAKLLFQ